MTHNIFVIFLKDLRETLRDRRNFLRMLFLPGFMIPLLGHFFLEFADSNREKLDKTPLTYAVAGAANLPELMKLYDADSSFLRVEVPENQFEEAIRAKRIRFALKVPADAKQKLANGEGVDVGFLYYQSAPSEGIVKDRGTAPLKEFGEKQRDWRLVFLGAGTPEARTTLLSPVNVEAINTASDRERIGHNLGTIIAYPLFIIVFMGCAYTGVELAAGENEKGTLEILVMLPIPRSAIVLGKYLVVFTLGLLYGTVSIVTLGGWLIFEGLHESQAFKAVLGQIGVSDMALVWLMLIPVSALFSAMVLALSIYARSYREASTLNALANFFVVATATAIFVPGVNLNWVWSLIPVSNVGLVIRDLIKGTLHNYLMIGSIFATTIVIGAALLLFSTIWFKRESVIFRD